MNALVAFLHMRFIIKWLPPFVKGGCFNITIPHCNKRFDNMKTTKEMQQKIWQYEDNKRKGRITYKDKLVEELRVWRKGVMPKQGVWKGMGKGDDQGYEYVCLFTTFIINALHTPYPSCCILTKSDHPKLTTYYTQLAHVFWTNHGSIN